MAIPHAQAAEMNVRRLVNYQILAVMFSISAAAVGRTSAMDLVLADGGRSAYRIVVARHASPSTLHGAAELQHFLREIANTELPIITDDEPLGSHEIVLGRSAHLDQLPTRVELSGLGPEGYVIRTVGPHLVIAGGDPRGNLYGVYGLLEDHMGCRWFTPTVSRIPQQDRLVLAELDERRVPLLEYREPFTYDCLDGDWCARNRVNSSNGRLEAKHGGKVSFGRGFFVHTFHGLVPPDKYFDEHPEYFSLINGRRTRDRSQLCCTNEDVIRICIEEIRRAMRAQPEALAFSVSQNDWSNYCECDTCQDLARREESQMAPVLQLVNRVAEAVENEFPDKVVETLAYQWTRKAPKTLTPRANVVVRLCSIECCFAHPLDTCDSEANRSFRADAQAWAKVADRLWVWDYVTDFRHYLLPFPNQRVRNDNIRFFIRNNVKGIFEQDTYNTPLSEMAELGGYLTAKFLWNPDYDEDEAIDEFLATYYEQAARPIRAYLDLIHDKVARENIHVTIWAEPDSPHLSDELLIAADRLWQQAEDAVAGNSELAHRVRLSRMSVDYAIVERVHRGIAGGQPPSATLRDRAAARLSPFLETLTACPLTRIDEWTELDKQQYSQQLLDALQ